MRIIAGFLIDEVNEEKFWSHGLSSHDVVEGLENPRILVPNRQGRAAPYLIIGCDHQERCIAVPVQPTNDPVIWRPVTAWFCKPHEAALLRKAKFGGGRN